ncbi:MAG: hypothetical protein N2Z21_10830, partial [Candidatus Sumerlaeaceae bacterium]|nr:hypothetical protein [Candidatus Sumerlaeaceae bacterium]
VVGISTVAPAAEDGAPAVPAAATPAPLQPPPGAGAPAAAGAPTLPALPGLGSDVSGAGAAGAVPTPPPLPSLGQVASEETGTTPSAAAPAAPVELYEFLFMKHDEYGPVRLKLTPQEAEKIREKEVNLLMKEFPASAQVQQGGQPQQDATRAIAEWDFYCEQLELYSDYVKEVVLPEKKDELDTPNFDFTKQEEPAQWRSDLKTTYEKKAQELTNEQRDENIAFYERLQQREDRRKRYYEWIASQQRELDEWAKVWARRANATQWVTASGEIRRDDWYYGKNFNAREPVATTIDGQTYVFSAEPVAGVRRDELNVISTNLTPYDILDKNGVLKNPATERQRGTLVEPPAQPTPTPVQGIIQVLGSQ